MRYFIITVSAIFVLVELAGCGVERVAIDPVGYKSVKQGEAITEEQAAQIVDGKTTRQEVYLMFGEPTSILEDGKVFIYNWIRGGEGNVLGFGTGSAEAHALVVTFDDDEVAIGHRITRGNVPTADSGS